MERYDAAVIGTGPAGLSAAVTLTLRNKKVLLLGSADLSRKLSLARRIDNYLGFPAVSGAELADRFRAHLDAMGISVTEDRITAVYAMGDYYALQGREMYEASSVILAAGVVQGKPIPGEEELLGSGVSYCATCDAALYRGKDTVVIGYSEREEKEAEFLSAVAAKVTYIPMYPGDTRLPEKVEVLRTRPLEIRGGLKKRTVVTAEGEIACDGVFILRDAVSAGQLVPGLETDGPHVKAGMDMATNLPGLFVCGDIAGKPYQYIKAAGQGNVAALSAVEYLAAKKHD